MNMRVFYKSLLFLLGFFSVQMKAETEVNVAGSGTAVQSTTYSNFGAQKAVDGSNSTCSGTDKQGNPWWRLDLKKSYSVNRVTITNVHFSCCVNLINGAEIRIGNDSSNVLGNPVCATVSSIPAGETNSFSCSGMKGRYVTVNIPGTLKAVTFCDMRVYVIFPDATLLSPTLPEDIPTAFPEDVPTDLLPDEGGPVSQEDSCEDET